MFKIWVYCLTQNLVSTIMSVVLLNPVLLTYVISIVSKTLSHIMSKSWLQMHWSVVVWIVTILCFVVCLPRISQGFKIYKIVWHALSLVIPEFLMSLQP